MTTPTAGRQTFFPDLSILLSLMARLSVPGPDCVVPAMARGDAPSEEEEEEAVDVSGGGG